MNCCYATLLSSDSYLPGVELLVASMKLVNSTYPLVVLVTEDLSDVVLNRLAELKLQTIKVSKVLTPDIIMQHNKSLDPRMAETWKFCLTKFAVWTLEQFDKVIMCDCDILFMKNCDHCFVMPEMTAALDGEYFGLWPKFPHFNTGFFVVKPNRTVYENLIKFANAIDPSKIIDGYGRKYVLADQEILNLYYKDWVNHPECRLSKYYNVFAPHIAKAAEADIKANAYFIHFVGSKPWLTNPNVPNYKSEVVSLYFYEVAYAVLKIFQDNADFSRDLCIRKLPEVLGMVAYEIYNDFTAAKAAYSEALTNKAVSVPEATAKNNIASFDKLIKAESYIELLKPIVLKMYNELAAEAKADVNAYLVQLGFTDYGHNFNSYQTVNQLFSVYDMWEKIKATLYKS